MKKNNRGLKDYNKLHGYKQEVKTPAFYLIAALRIIKDYGGKAIKILLTHIPEIHPIL